MGIIRNVKYLIHYVCCWPYVVLPFEITRGRRMKAEHRKRGLCLFSCIFCPTSLSYVPFRKIAKTTKTLAERHPS